MSSKTITADNSIIVVGNNNIVGNVGSDVNSNRTIERLLDMVEKLIVQSQEKDKEIERLLNIIESMQSI